MATPRASGPACPPAPRVPEWAAMDTLYREPAYYRMLFDGRSADLPFYLQHAKSEILEIGVGAGRVAIALAREGHRVHGVDLAPDMLSALETRLAEEPPELASRISFRQADARTVRLDRTFARVFIPFNGIAHYPSASDLGALLGTVRAHLAPGGLFVFDAMLPDPMLLAEGGSSTPSFTHPRTGEICRAEETYRYDAMTQILTITTSIRERLRDSKEQVLSLSLRQFFPQETLLLLEHHGFEVVAREESLGDTLGYVCRARPV